MAYNKREEFLKSFFGLGGKKPKKPKEANKITIKKKPVPASAPESKESFPVTQAESKAVSRIERKVGAKPKQKLTSEKLDELARKQGKKRMVYSEQWTGERLLKAFERRDDYTLVDPREYYGALESVSKRLLEWLKSQVSGMENSEVKTVDMPVKGAKLKVRKLAGDLYSGWVIDKKGDIEHLYDRLTLPALASQVMAVYEVYNEEEDDKFTQDPPRELHSLKEEIESINAELKSLKGKKNKAVVGKRLKALIEELANLHESVENHKVDSKAEIGEVHQKLSELRGMIQPIEPPPIKDIKPELEDKVEAKQIGEPGRCDDCDRNPCQCFIHLPKPVIEVEPNGKVTIMFKSEIWNDLDKMNWLKAMKYAINKKRK